MRRLRHSLRESKAAFVRYRCNSDAGDTLVEVLMTLIVLSLCVVAFMLAFSTSITASAEHRNLATMGTALRSVSEAALSQIQQQPSPLFTPCATPSSYSTVNFGAPTGYSAAITSVQYWNGTSFGTSCPSGSTSPQQITISVTGPLSTASSITMVVDDPTYSTTTGYATKLVFTTEPSGGKKDSPLSTQPVLTVEDSSGKAVTSDHSSVNLTITPGTGTSGASLSGCTQSENSGVITFSGCTIDKSGEGYTLTATDGSLTAVSTAFDVSGSD